MKFSFYFNISIKKIHVLDEFDSYRFFNKGIFKKGWVDVFCFTF